MKFIYLKHIEIPWVDKDKIWSICPYTGSLVYEKLTNGNSKTRLPNKVVDALEYCNNPYKCKFNSEPEIGFPEDRQNRLIGIYKRFVKIGNNRFFFNRVYTSFKKYLFTDTSQAIVNISYLPINADLKRQMCLQRTFLAAKISESFESKGVIFIGAFLPTGDMHAWIIEDGTQPDYNDRVWINYRPLLAFYH